MPLQRRKIISQAALLPAALLSKPVAAQNTPIAQGAVGAVERLDGQASRISNQGTQALQVGHSVYEGDRVVTSANSEAVFKLLDGAVIAVRPSTELSLAQYRFSQQKPQDSSVLLQLARGGLRKLTGLIGKTNPGAVKITTATATIGIRGTEFEVTHVEPPAPSAPPPAGSPAPPPPAADDPQAGSYVRVYSGLTTLQSNEDNRQIEVPAGQTAFAPNLAVALAVGGAVVQTFGLLRNSPAKAFFNGKFDGSMQSLSNTMTNELQNRMNQQINRNLPSNIRNMLPDLGNIFRR